MPLLKRKPFKRNPLPEGIRDDDEVYYCEATKEIFKNYDDFFERVMLTNSVIWQCSLTGRPDLTFSEAVASEKTARKILRQFPSALRGPVILVASLTKRSGLRDLVDDVFNNIKDRFFVNEKLDVMNESGRGCRFCKITDIILPEKHDQSQSFDYSKIKYRVMAIDDEKEPQEWVAKAESLRRDKNVFSKEKIKLFLKQHMEGMNSMLIVKSESIKKYVTDRNVKPEQVFIGKMPDFEVSKKIIQKQEKSANKKEKTSPKATTKKKTDKSGSKKNGKQGDITKYLNNSGSKTLTAEEKKKRDEESKKFREELEAKRKEKADREAEKLRKIAEEKARIVQKTQATIRELNLMRDDLELIDQRIIPKGKAVSTLIARKYFGEFVKVMDFLHSFPEVLLIQDKFPFGVTMEILESALLLRDVNGPLSDIFQVLLSTIFSLQIEEENEFSVEHRIHGDSTLKHSKLEFMQNASRVHLWIEKHYHMKLNLLAIDSTTLSELLRLHLLSSGANLSERSSRNRYITRGGYRSSDDPGIDFVLKYSHITKFLTQYSVFQLSMRDILRIMNCLIDQILTYPNIRDIIEDRMEKSTAAKIEYRSLKAAESRRERKTAEAKKALQEEHKTIIAGYDSETPSVKEALTKTAEAELEKKLAKIDLQYAKEREQYLADITTQTSIFFNYQTFLGTDRAFRNYYIFESLPGLFVEHDITYAGTCLDKFIANNPSLAHCTKEQRYTLIKQMITSEETGSSDDKENKIDVNGTLQEKNGNANAPKKENDSDIQRDLLMCNCDPATCIVHSENVERDKWTFYSTAEEIDALIESLNMKGFREKNLRAQLEENRNLIVDYIKKCPTEKLLRSTGDDTTDRDEAYREMKKKRSAMNKIKQLNFGFTMSSDPNITFEKYLRITLLEFEKKITKGCLGSLKVQDRDLWIKYIEEGEYYALNDNLKWGAAYNGVVNGNHVNGKEEGSEIEDHESETASSIGDFDIMQTLDSGNCSDVDSDENEVTEMKSSDIEAVKLKVKNLAMALLQIEQGIEIKFIRAPFGPVKDIKDRELFAKALELSKKKLLKWEESLMKSTSYSQVFLHYTTLYDSIKWSQSIEKIGCLVCRKKQDPEQTLLCDECNKGWHMYCLRPKLTEVPTGDWFCPRCRPEDFIVKRSRKRRAIVEESEESELEEDEQENDGSSDDYSKSDNELCTVCGSEGELVHCTECSTQCHLECAKPACKSIKSKKWKCSKCVTAAQREERFKRRRIQKDGDDLENGTEDQNEEIDIEMTSEKQKTSSRRSKRERAYEESDDSSDEMPAKKFASGQGSRRLSNRVSRRSSLETDENVRTSRRISRKLAEDSITDRRASKRSLEFLDTISLGTLIDEIIKHKYAWPFTKPVSINEVPDYFDVIKQPMDFSKIKSKLNLGSYTSNEQVMKDIELVFSNCDLYNVADSEIYKAGSKLEKFVAKRCKDLCLPFEKSDMSA